MNLNDPAKFAWVCPALATSPVGLRCKHAKADVRPYWLRAIIFTTASLTLAYTAASTSWFGLLRYHGLSEVNWSDCAWPAQWANITTARGAFFRAQATEALLRNDISGAIRSLSSSVASCPDCWEDGLLLAKLYEHIGQFAAADRLFHTLTQRFPQHREIIAINHHDAMLASQRLTDLHQLSWQNLMTDPLINSSWFVPLVLTVPNLGNPALFWLEHAADIARLPQELRQLLSIVIRPPDTSFSSAVERALSTPSTSPLTARLRWEILLRAGARDAAIRSFRQDEQYLSSFEFALAQWATLDPRVSHEIYARFWERAIPASIKPYHIERLCAVALLNPRPAPLSQLRVRLDESDRSSLAALWAVSSFQGNPALARRLSNDLGLDPANTENGLTRSNALKTLPVFASIIPIPREVLYALIADQNFFATSSNPVR